MMGVLQQGLLWTMAWLLGMGGFVCDEALSYTRAVEGPINVKRKLYKRKDRLEINGPNAGVILNQSYIESLAFNIGFVYHYSRTWGFGLDYTFMDNSDKVERQCIENFYNDPLSELNSPCDDGRGDPADFTDTKANYGPAYVPIREIENMVLFNLEWTPVYGKQLIFLSATSYFDLYFEFGGGMTNSLFYPEQKTLVNENPSRGTFQENGDPLDGNPIGAGADEVNSYGIAGRPLPKEESHLTVNLAIGQKFHFASRFHLKVLLRNLTLIGTQDGFQNLFIVYGGLGMRI